MRSVLGSVRSGAALSVPMMRADRAVSCGWPLRGEYVVSGLLGPPPAVRSWLANLSTGWKAGGPTRDGVSELPWRSAASGRDDMSLRSVVERLLQSEVVWTPPLALRDEDH